MFELSRLVLSKWHWYGLPTKLNPDKILGGVTKPKFGVPT